jgi:hypothetical protein
MTIDTDSQLLMKVDEALFAVVKFYQEVAPERWPPYAVSARIALIALRKETGRGHDD